MQDFQSVSDYFTTLWSKGLTAAIFYIDITYWKVENGQLFFSQQHGLFLGDSVGMLHFICFFIKINTTENS